ncbi:MAG TPA: PDGLE domain-containing protein [Cryptosporangiaceae bacterium]|nr:PDGLE domain-containing protein [Cryptosporangiaceae bacterium]
MTSDALPTRRLVPFLAAGLLVALFLAGVVSNYASTQPDGLDAAARAGCTFDADGRITGGDCVARRSADHTMADAPLADYGVKGIGNPFVATGLSGIAGVLIVLALGGGLFWTIRCRGGTTPGGADAG